MNRKFTLLLMSGILTGQLGFGQWIGKDSTLTNEGDYGNIQWGSDVTVTIPQGVTINAAGISAGGNMVINGNLNLDNGTFQLYGQNGVLTVGENATIQTGTFSTSGNAVFGENSQTTVGTFSPNLSNGESIQIKRGAQFTANGNSTINAGALEIAEGGQFIVNADLDLANPNNKIEGTLKITGKLQLNNAPNQINCPGQVLAYDLVNASGTPPMEGTGYVEVQHSFTGLNALTGSSGITLNLSNTVLNTGNPGAATLGTETACAPSTLPVHIKLFTAVAAGTRVQLNWTTTTEINNKVFTLERSKDGINYVAIGQLASKAEGANSSTEIGYTYFDINPIKGMNYYRLKQTDINGQTSYYPKTKSVLFQQTANIHLYPNPVHNTLHITGADNQNTVYKIINANGKLVISTEQSDINVSSLSKGVYFLEVIDQNKVIQTARFIKN